MGGGGRVADRRSPPKNSVSPDSRFRKKGQDFIEQLESLQEDLEVQGNAFQLLENELKFE